MFKLFNRLNKKGFCMLDIMTSVFFLFFLSVGINILISNFQQVEDINKKSLILIQETDSYLEELYISEDWNLLNGVELNITPDILAKHIYNETTFNTEQLKIVFQFNNNEFEYILERRL